MLTFEEKLSIIRTFPELEEKQVSMGRRNFHYNESSTDKKNVVYHLHPNGNGFVYAEGLSGYNVDSRGLVNIRDFSSEELKTIIEKSLLSLAPKTSGEEAIVGEEYEEKWLNREGHTLTLIAEDDMWNVYAGMNLDGTFLSYAEATSYLDEEGFSKI